MQCHLLHCSAVHACYCPRCIVPWSLLSRLDISHFFTIKRPSTSPLAPSSAGEDTSLLSKVLQDLSGASSLEDERMGHYLATWALSCPLAGQQFNNAVQYVNTATSTQTTGEACKAAVEACAASLLPPTTMCELVLNIRAPKSSWSYTRSVSWSTTAPSPMPPNSVKFAPSGTSKPIGRSWPPLWNWIPSLARCWAKPPGSHGLMGQVHPPLAGLCAANQALLPVDIHCPGGCLARGRGQLDPTHHLLGQLRPLGLLPGGPLGVLHGQLR